MWFITCFKEYSNNTESLIGKHFRCFGYYKTEEDAIAAVTENCCDIQERCYDYAMVEYIPGGVYALAEKRLFFKWNDELEMFEPIPSLDDSPQCYAFCGC